MFDWISDLISGIGDAISGAFTALWDTISSSIWDLFLRWIYEAIYGAIADFFTFMSNMGAGMFDLAWVQGAIKLFSLFGWALFAAGLVVAVFDTAIEYQSMGRLNIKRQIMPVLYGFLAVSCFTTVPVELYKFCITLQNTFSHDLTTIFGGAGLGASGIVGAASSALQILNGIPSVFNLLFMIALGYCVIKIFFANIKRGGILLTQIAVGSLYMFSIPKGYVCHADDRNGFFTRRFLLAYGLDLSGDFVFKHRDSFLSLWLVKVHPFGMYVKIAPCERFCAVRTGSCPNHVALSAVSGYVFLLLLLSVGSPETQITAGCGKIDKQNEWQKRKSRERYYTSLG